MKPFWHSKTLAANLGLALLAWWFQRSEFYVDPLWFVWVIAGVNIVLRLVTSTGLVYRDEKQ